MINILYIIAGFIFGIIFAKTMFGKKEGHHGVLKNWRFKLMGRTLIIHHWILFIAYIICMTFAQKRADLFPDIVFYTGTGFLLGGIFQGLTYKDWYVFIK